MCGSTPASRSTSRRPSACKACSTVSAHGGPGDETAALTLTPGPHSVDSGAEITFPAGAVAPRAAGQSPR